MAEIVKEDEFDKSEYYDEEGNTIYCKDTEILFQGSPGGRGEPEERPDGSIRRPFLMAVYSGNLWAQKIASWPWSHYNMESNFVENFGIDGTPAENFAENYNYYADAWMRDIPAEVWMFLASRPFRLIPDPEGHSGLSAAIKLHEDPEKAKELKKAAEEATESWRDYVKASRKLGMHGYVEGPRNPKTIMMNEAVQLKDKICKINTHFNQIRWIEYNIRFKNEMEEWADIFGEKHHEDWVANTADSFEKIGLLLDQGELECEEEDN